MGFCPRVVIRVGLKSEEGVRVNFLDRLGFVQTSFLGLVPFCSRPKDLSYANEHAG